MNTSRMNRSPRVIMGGLELGFLCTLLLGLFSCGEERAVPSETKIDSAHAVALEGNITAGFILTKETEDAKILAEVERQLFYTVGQLNGEGGVGELGGLTIQLGERATHAEGVFKVSYAAHFTVAWPRDGAFTDEYELHLPIGMYAESFDPFYQAFGPDGAACMDPSAHDVTPGILWYYYRPQACMDLILASDAVASFPVKLTISPQNTSGHFPEYDMIWKDGSLIVTAIFGKEREGATADTDAGIAAYNEAFAMFKANFGKPTKISIPAETLVPGPGLPEIYMEFKTAQGKIDLAMFLIEGILKVEKPFIDQYNARTQISDYISYNGHSGLGANIQALAKLGTFVKDQYQIYLVNGCDTFAYLDDALVKAHHVANPGSTPTKYFDFITNAMPAFFQTLAESNTIMIRSLLDQKLTYFNILEQFDSSQKAIVVGEEDNSWQPAAPTEPTEPPAPQ